MLRYLLAGALALSAPAGLAATLDFSTPDFASTFPALSDPPSVAAVSVDGVTFTVTAAQAVGTNGFRQAFDTTGLSMGRSGNGMLAITIVANADVTYTSFFGEDRGDPQRTTPQLFDLLVNNVYREQGLSFGSSFASVDFTDITVAAGDVLRIAVDASARPGYSFLFANAVLGSIDFEKVSVSQIPLPAGVPLLLTGIAAFGLLRRRQV